MSKIPHTAMVLAAGMGQRMRPLTLERPKPLLEVGGRTMLDIVLDRLKDFGIQRVVVNAHYMPDKIEAHVKARRDLSLIVSKEADLLDTGGGVKHALAHLGDDPIFIVNSDLPWQDGATPALARLANMFDVEKMDALLLVAGLSNTSTRGFTGAKGDFFLKENGVLHRAGTAAPRPYVFISAQIAKPQLFASVNERVFSNNRIWDEAEKKDRLYGVAHDSACYHVGTPPDLAESNRLLQTGAGW
jgi:MurNAc alpha-1-phosphate uridylyltransferase